MCDPSQVLNQFSHPYSSDASCEEHLLITNEIEECKIKIKALEQEIFTSALAQIAAEVTSPDFTAKFSAAAIGTGMDSFRKMNELPLDVQVCGVFSAAL